MSPDKHGAVTERLTTLATRWNVVIGKRHHTNNALIAYGVRNGDAVVLKVVRHESDEWHAGAILSAFAGQGFARCLEHEPGALLMERLNPGTELVSLCDAGRDDEATRLLAHVIRGLPVVMSTYAPRVVEAARAFEDFIDRGDTRLPRALVQHAHATYIALADSQRTVRLLHGDLHHYNILLDKRRGWLAIDPKGVTGELEFEVGAMLRNPHSQLALVRDIDRVDARVAILAAELTLDPDRIRRWAFAQAVLSVLWTLEDDEELTVDNPAWLLARVLATKVDKR